jgi:hypothetical protein
MAQLAAFAPAVGVLSQIGTASQGANITVGVSSTNASIDATGRYNQYRFVNNGPNVIFLAGSASGAAAPVATTSSTWVMLGNTVEVFTLPPNCQVAAIAAATGNTLSVIPGEGI